MTVLCVYVTYKDQAQAQAVSKAAIDARLAACANIFHVHESLYCWDGAVQNSTEVAVLYKTTAALYPALEAKIKALHSYECPCIVAWQLEHGNPAFLEWIHETVQTQ